MTTTAATIEQKGRKRTPTAFATSAALGELTGGYALINALTLQTDRRGGGDADVSCTAWFCTTLLGVVIHVCRRHAAPTQAQVRLHRTT